MADFPTVRKSAVLWDRIVPETELPVELMDQFACGQPVLDEWWLEKSLNYSRIGMCATHVAVSEDGIIGFFTLSPTTLEGKMLPARRRAGKPTMQHPGYLLGMFAVRADLQGSGVGGALLCHAIHITLKASALIGGRFLAVDPIDESTAKWYEKYGFLSLKTSTRRFMPLKTARRLMDTLPEDFFVFDSTIQAGE